jgi:hypothetical protein
MLIGVTPFTGVFIQSRNLTRHVRKGFIERVSK